MSVHTRRGYVFEKEVHEGLDLIKGMMVFKVPDSKSMRQITPVKAPSDFIFANIYGMYTIEAKQTKLARIPWSNFRQHQIDWVLHTPGAYFVINFNNRNDVNRVFFLTGNDMKYLIGNFEKSVPMEEMAKVGVELERKTARFNTSGGGAFVDFGKLFEPV